MLMVSDPLAMNLSNTLGYLRGELKDVERRNLFRLEGACWKLDLSRRLFWRFITRFLVGIIRNQCHSESGIYPSNDLRTTKNTGTFNPVFSHHLLSLIGRQRLA